MSKLQRCENKGHKDFPSYGGAGILLQEEWSCSFEQFLMDVGECPTDRDDYSLDRIDNSQGYIKGNVRWASPVQQSHNKSLQKNNTSGVTGVIPTKYKGFKLLGLRIGGMRLESCTKNLFRLKSWETMKHSSQRVNSDQK